MKNVRVVVEIFDDLDGSEADETVTFGFAGVNYEIDLSAANAEMLGKSLQPFIEKARVQPKKAAGDPATVRKLRNAQRIEIRQWARRNGFSIGDKGVISMEIMEGWKVAHPRTAIIEEPEPEVPLTAQEVNATGGEVAALMPRARDRRAEQASKARRNEIRKWARKHKIDVALTGIIPATAVDAFYAAHPELSED